MNKDKCKNVVNMVDGDVSFWLEGDSSILMRVGTNHGNDYVEIESNEARKIATKLIEMADVIDAQLQDNL